MAASQDTGPVFVARGTARLETDPELVQLTAVIRVGGKSRVQVCSGAAERSRLCMELIDGYGEAIERYETSGLTVDPGDWDGWHREAADLWLGTVTLTITVADFAVLGELTARLAAMELTEIHGPRWGLRPDSEVFRQAMRAAVKDAVVRGREYAQALGCRLTGLVELADRGLSTTANGRPSPRIPPVGQFEEELIMEGAVLPPIGMTPERQTVEASVKARFTATAPESL